MPGLWTENTANCSYQNILCEQNVQIFIFEPDGTYTHHGALKDLKR